MRLQNTGTHDGADEIFMTFAPGGHNEHSNEGDRDVVSQSVTDTYEDPLDDVFGSAPPSPYPPNDEDETTLPSQESARRDVQDPSDIPRLRSVHVTNGYREGLSASKEQHVQSGFDEGYSLGAELGMKVGWLMGVLEGVGRALPAFSSKGEAGVDGGEGVSRESVRVELKQAEEEMSMRRLFGEEFFGGDEVWIYPVSGTEREGEEGVTFKEVAEAHPLVVKWAKRVRDLAEKAGLNIREDE